VVFRCVLARSTCAPFRHVRAPRSCTRRCSLRATGIKNSNGVQGRGHGNSAGGLPLDALPGVRWLVSVRRRSLFTPPQDQFCRKKMVSLCPLVAPAQSVHHRWAVPIFQSWHVKGVHIRASTSHSMRPIPCMLSSHILPPGLPREGRAEEGRARLVSWQARPWSRVVRVCKHPQ